MKQAPQVVLGVSLAVAVGALVLCYMPDTHTVRITARLDGERAVIERGEREEFAQLDAEDLRSGVHSFAVLTHKDRIEWICDGCGPELEFRVEDVQNLGDLHLLADLFSSDATPRLAGDIADLVGGFLGDTVATAEGAVASAPLPPDSAARNEAAFELVDRLRAIQEQSSSDARRAQAAGRPLADAAAGIGKIVERLDHVGGDNEMARTPFGDWQPPEEFTPGNRSVKSPGFVKLEPGHSYLYKFTWVVRPAGAPKPDDWECLPSGRYPEDASWDCWDPHFIGCAEKR